MCPTNVGDTAPTRDREFYRNVSEHDQEMPQLHTTDPKDVIMNWHTHVGDMVGKCDGQMEGWKTGENQRSPDRCLTDRGRHFNYPSRIRYFYVLEMFDTR